MELCLESRWYGHSLIELGNLTQDDQGCICYDEVNLIPRKHVIPEYHRCFQNVGDDALQRDSKGIFRFNPGIEQKTVPDYNPYTIRRCRDCDIAKGRTKLAKLPFGNNQLCKACHLLHQCSNGFHTLNEYGERLKISNDADMSEIVPNTRVAKVLLDTFRDMEIKIREHIIEANVKNPEYVINGLIADRKGIESEKGITAGFKKEIKQNCSYVVIVLDMNMSNQPLRTVKLAQYMDGRKRDFVNGVIKECYVIFKGKAVKITSWSSRQDLTAQLEKLRP